MVTGGFAYQRDLNEVLRSTAWLHTGGIRLVEYLEAQASYHDAC